MFVINVSAVSSGGVGPGNMTITRTAAEGKDVLKVVLKIDLTPITKSKDVLKKVGHKLLKSLKVASHCTV